jgi:hypothetical protein
MTKKTPQFMTENTSKFYNLEHYQLLLLKKLIFLTINSKNSSQF